MLKKDIVIECICGCGTLIKKYRSNYDEVKYVKGHQKSRLGKKLTNEQKINISKGRVGKGLGKDNFKWKEDVGYYGLHTWINRRKKKKGTCEHCKNQKRTQWANKSHEYKRDLEDWIELCQSCHWKYDKETWGQARKKFNL